MFFSMFSHEINQPTFHLSGREVEELEKPAFADQDEGRTSLPGRLGEEDQEKYVDIILIFGILSI